jgi:uncharacterized PurR-regulated membrane protein YhhQ (DUF165 family)
MDIYSFEQLGAGRQSQAEERKELSSFLALKLASRLFSRVLYTNYKGSNAMANALSNIKSWLPRLLIATFAPFLASQDAKSPIK